MLRAYRNSALEKIFEQNYPRTVRTSDAGGERFGVDLRDADGVLLVADDAEVVDGTHVENVLFARLKETIGNTDTASAWSAPVSSLCNPSALNSR